MPSEFDRKVRLDFSGVDQSRDSHLVNDSSWENCEGFRPYHGTMESLPQLVKNYEVLPIRSNPSSPIKVMEPVYDQSTDSFSYLCLSERQAWLQDPNVLLQTSGTAAQIIKKAFDFSTDEDDLVGTQMTLSGNNDGITDDFTTSHNDCFAAYATASSSVHRVSFDLADYGIAAGESFRIQGKYLIKTGNTHVDNVRLLETPAYTLTAVGVWTDFSYDVASVGNTTFVIGAYDGAVSTYMGAGSPSDDIFWLTDLYITKLSTGTTPDVEPFNDQTEVPILLKTSSVTTPTDYTAQCLLTGFKASNEATDFPNINDYLWVEITSATTAILKKSVNGVESFLYPSDNPTYTSGTLVNGLTYKITNYVAGDDFSNIDTVIEGVSNTTGCVFLSTGTTPTVWTNGSAVQVIDFLISREITITGTDYSVYFFMILMVFTKATT